MTLNFGLNDTCFASEIQQKCQLLEKELQSGRINVQDYVQLSSRHRPLRLNQEGLPLNIWHHSNLLWFRQTRKFSFIKHSILVCVKKEKRKVYAGAFMNENSNFRRGQVTVDRCQIFLLPPDDADGLNLELQP